jgi:hypothetical protein
LAVLEAFISQIGVAPAEPLRLIIPSLTTQLAFQFVDASFLDFPATTNRTNRRRAKSHNRDGSHRDGRENAGPEKNK